MSIPPWDWEALAFVQDADLTKQIGDALKQERPEAAIYARWPWVRNAVIEEFVKKISVARGADTRLEIERFQHTIRAAWSDKYEPKMYRRAPRRRRRWWPFTRGDG